jgi:hypothetical protein
LLKVQYCTQPFYDILPPREWTGRIFEQEFDQHNYESVEREQEILAYTSKIHTMGKSDWHKKSIGISPFQMVYGIDVVLPIKLSLPVMKLWQDEKEEPNHITRRINQLIEL